MTISDKLLQVNQVKQDIKTAIEMKGIPMTNVAFTEYANKIADISGGGWDISYEEYALALYYRFGKLAIFANAWESSLAVDPLEISADGSPGGGGGGGASSGARGTAQYPNGEIDGVIIPYGVTSIGNYAFQNWSSNNQPLVIPNSVTSIGDSAFSFWRTNNQPLVIPNSVTSIGYNAFYNWSSNTHPLVIPDSVTSIGEYAFFGWSSNNQPLVIPNSVTSIGSYAFYNWLLVPYVEIQAITPPTLASASAFDNQGNAPIYVPDESVTAYKNATNWVDLADRIFSINDK